LGARLSYVKVIDSGEFLARGGRLSPGLPNLVLVRSEPGVAATLKVLRGWDHGHGTYTEQWRIEDPGGLTIYESVPREIHLPTPEHVERLEDEVSDLKIDYAADGFSLIVSLDEAARATVQFTVQTEKDSQET
jgi:hypothetical protein